MQRFYSIGNVILQQQQKQKSKQESKIFTCSRESQLSASHSSVSNIPCIITHSAPGLVLTDLHTSLVGYRTTNESDVTIGTD